MVEPKAHTSEEGVTAMLSPGDVGREACRMMPGGAACWALLPGAGRREKWKNSSALSLHLQHRSPYKRGWRGRGFPTGPRITQTSPEGVL